MSASDFGSAAELQGDKEDFGDKSAVKDAKAKASDAAGQAKAKASDVAGQAKDKANEVAGQAKAKASDAADSASKTYDPG